MGGVGSGQRIISRATVADSLALDICRLMRDGQLRPGSWTSGTLHWRVVGTELEVSALAYEANLADPAAAWLRLRFAVSDDGEGWRWVDRQVQLTTTRQHHGSARWWFLCPVSGRRCAKLHRMPGGDVFAARQVWNLAYESQRMAPLKRRGQAIINSEARISRRLGRAGDRILYGEIPPRPKGMWRKTYERLRQEVRDAERRAHALF